MKMRQGLTGVLLALNAANCAGTEGVGDVACGEKTITVVDVESPMKSALINEVKLEEGERAEGVFNFNFLNPAVYDDSLLLDTRQKVQTMCKELIKQKEQYSEQTYTILRCGKLLVNEDGSLKKSVGAGYRADQMDVPFYEYPLQCEDFLGGSSDVNPGNVQNAKQGEFYYKFSENWASPTDTEEGDRFKEVCWPHVVYYPASTHHFYCSSWDKDYTPEEICESETDVMETEQNWKYYVESQGCFFED